MKAPFLAGIMCLALSACASGPQKNRGGEDEATFRGAAMDTGRNLPDIAQAPLRDLNLTREVIPPILDGMPYAYRTTEDLSCEQILAEVRALTMVLGPDSDIAEDQLSLKEQSVEAASDAANNALEDVATGWIPYRSAVRRITGASAHEREVRKAYQRGRMRRSFLKGIGLAKGCPYPAAPASIRNPREF